jgi:hypothetical protein
MSDGSRRRIRRVAPPPPPPRRGPQRGGMAGHGTQTRMAPCSSWTAIPAATVPVCGNSLRLAGDRTVTASPGTGPPFSLGTGPPFSLRVGDGVGPQRGLGRDCHSAGGHPVIPSSLKTAWIEFLRLSLSTALELLALFLLALFLLLQRLSLELSNSLTK